MRRPWLGALHKSQSATHISNWRNQKKGTDLVFKPHVFLSFGKVQFQQTKVKKMQKLSARANQMLIGVPILKHEPGTDLKNFYFPSLFKEE